MHAKTASVCRTETIVVVKIWGFETITDSSSKTNVNLAHVNIHLLAHFLAHWALLSKLLYSAFTCPLLSKLSISIFLPTEQMPPTFSLVGVLLVGVLRNLTTHQMPALSGPHLTYGLDSIRMKRHALASCSAQSDVCELKFWPDALVSPYIKFWPAAWEHMNMCTVPGTAGPAPEAPDGPAPAGAAARAQAQGRRGRTHEGLPSRILECWNGNLILIWKIIAAQCVGLQNQVFNPWTTESWRTNNFEDLWLWNNWRTKHSVQSSTVSCNIQLLSYLHLDLFLVS